MFGRRAGRPYLTSTLAGVILAGAMVATGAQGTAAVTCGCWVSTTAPNPGTEDGLDGVAATSTSNAWAVGSNNNGTTTRAVILRWNGISWQSAPHPGAGGASAANVLNGVAATSASNAWAVGWVNAGTGSGSNSLIMHWNGTAWKVASAPSVAYSELKGVAATSSTNAWAVGDFTTNTAVRTLILHWNGTMWKVVKSPNVGGLDAGNYLKGVAAISSTNAWAVGKYNSGSGERTLILHWNGTAWKVVTSPNRGTSSATNNLYGVAATSATNVWAVGFYANATAGQTLILHWNGTAWKPAPSPDPGGSSNNNSLFAVTATSRTNAWAVGRYYNGSADRTLILQWNGTAWKSRSSPNPGGTSAVNELDAVASTSSTNAWAAGYYSNGATTQNLMEHCC